MYIHTCIYYYQIHNREGIRNPPHGDVLGSSIGRALGTTSSTRTKVYGYCGLPGYNFESPDSIIQCTINMRQTNITPAWTQNKL